MADQSMRSMIMSCKRRGSVVSWIYDQRSYLYINFHNQWGALHVRLPKYGCPTGLSFSFSLDVVVHLDLSTQFFTAAYHSHALLGLHPFQGETQSLVTTW